MNRQPLDGLDRHQPLFAEARGDIQVSFEFFPPKTEKMEETLWASVKTLEPLAPRFVSVTYGAGGSTRERTHATVARIARETNIPAAAHLTCVEAIREEIDQVADDYWNAGVRHIVALRGDPPRAGEKYATHPGGYENAADLVAGLRKLHPFEISVAAYPECHPDSPDAAADIDNLKRKLDAGADSAITQYFFNADSYYHFVDEAFLDQWLQAFRCFQGEFPGENGGVLRPHGHNARCRAGSSRRRCGGPPLFHTSPKP